MPKPSRSLCLMMKCPHTGIFYSRLVTPMGTTPHCQGLNLVFALQHAIMDQGCQQGRQQV